MKKLLLLIAILPLLATAQIAQRCPQFTPYGTGYYSLQVTGVISVTTGGTWNPLIAFSGLPGAGSAVLGGSQVEIWPVGEANTTVSIGNWT